MATITDQMSSSNQHKRGVNGDAVDENDDEGDYDNVQGRLTVAVDRSAVDVNNARSVTNAETGSAIHSNPTAMETVTASETTRQSGTTKAKKEKKMFSWGQKKKKKPRTAAEWSAMAPAGDNGPMLGTVSLQSTEPNPEQEKEPERSAPLTITPLGNSYYGSQTSLNEDQKIPGSPDTPIGHASFWACCAAPPPPKPKKEKKEKEKKEKKPKKEKKTKKDKFDERHNLPDGFQCNGGDEVNAVVIGDRGPADGDYMDRHPPEGEQDEVHMPRMVDPQKVLVMLPVDQQNRPAVGPKAAGSTGVMPGQAPVKDVTDGITVKDSNRQQYD